MSYSGMKKKINKKKLSALALHLYLSLMAPDEHHEWNKRRD